MQQKKVWNTWHFQNENLFTFVMVNAFVSLNGVPFTKTFFIKNVV